MILTIDIGNSNIVFAGLSEHTIHFMARAATNLRLTYEEYAVYIQNIFLLHNVNKQDLEGAILSSVSPALSGTIVKALQTSTGISPLCVGPGIKTGLNILVDNPNQLGRDRVVDAVGAIHYYKAPAMIIDMGTATTMSVIDQDHSFLGGIIVPGIKISMEALTRNTSQLPQTALEDSAQLIGKNTVSCMQSGVLYGNASIVDGLIERVELETGSNLTFIATGGLARFIVPHCKRQIVYDEYLLLKGLYILYQKNK